MVRKETAIHKKDCEPSLSVAEKDKQAFGRCFDEMNVIARGVKARLDLPTALSKIVTQMTLDIGRRLGIPEKEIQWWATLISVHASERNGVIKPSLNRLKRSLLLRT